MLTSLQNPQVKHVMSLQRRKGREGAKEFVVEGRRFVTEALLRGADIKQVYYYPQRMPADWQLLLAELAQKRISVEEVDEKVLRKMTDTVEPQGILAVVGQPVYTWTDIKAASDTVLLIIDGIQDPGNLGTIVRTALAAGVNQICLTEGTVDLYNPKVLRSTMGAIFSLITLPEQTPEDILAYCRSHGLRLVTADIKGNSPYEKDILHPPLALVVGNEGNGPSAILRSKAAQTVTIPMKNGVESLNAALATGILLYEIVRRRDYN